VTWWRTGQTDNGKGCRRAAANEVLNVQAIKALIDADPIISDGAHHIKDSLCGEVCSETQVDRNNWTGDYLVLDFDWERYHGPGDQVGSDVSSRPNVA
jgi:hypothetical protein